MKKPLSRVIIDTMREYTPLWARKSIGPLIGYAVYFSNVYIRKNRRVPTVLSMNDTINRIKKDNLSVVRFGDGEMSLINNGFAAYICPAVE